MEEPDQRVNHPAATTTIIIAVGRTGRCQRLKPKGCRSLTAIVAAAVGVGCQAGGIDRLPTATPLTAVLLVLVLVQVLVVASRTRAVTETLQPIYP